MADVIRLVEVRDRPLSVDEVYVSVTDDRSGGVALFVGTVRDHDSGRTVDRLEYSAHPTVQAQLEQVASAVAERYEVVAVSAVHRVGARHSPRRRHTALRQRSRPVPTMLRSEEH